MAGGIPHVAAIVNPRSGGGRTGRAWRVIAETLERQLGPIRPHFTGGPSTPSRHLCLRSTPPDVHAG